MNLYFTNGKDISQKNTGIGSGFAPAFDYAKKNIDICFNPSPAEPGYVLPLQTV